jgi:hypothetical protein
LATTVFAVGYGGGDVLIDGLEEGGVGRRKRGDCERVEDVAAELEDGLGVTAKMVIKQ